jgi:ABC-type Mn2+/Zn2+ transport system permease subunit
MLGLAVAISVGSTLAGVALAHVLRREAGPLVIVVAAGVFFVSLLRRRR